MTISGVSSGRTYEEDDILKNAVYADMKMEPLRNEDGILVVPVRNQQRPHFRRLGDGIRSQRIGGTEPDPTHKKVVGWLKKKLPQHPLRVVTLVWDKGQQQLSGDTRADQQVIFLSGTANQYIWCTEAECRIRFSDGRYIEPDIGGRDREVFSPSTGHETILIEVIQTHYPEQETFFRLLSLSSVGHLVIFYFIAPDRWTSKYNGVTELDSLLELRAAYYLANGRVFKNAHEWQRRSGHTDEQWYLYLESTYFKQAMEGK